MKNRIIIEYFVPIKRKKRNGSLNIFSTRDLSQYRNQTHQHFNSIFLFLTPRCKSYNSPRSAPKWNDLTWCRIIFSLRFNISEKSVFKLYFFLIGLMFMTFKCFLNITAFNIIFTNLHIFVTNICSALHSELWQTTGDLWQLTMANWVGITNQHLHMELLKICHSILESFGPPSLISDNIA